MFYNVFLCCFCVLKEVWLFIIIQIIAYWTVSICLIETYFASARMIPPSRRLKSRKLPMPPCPPARRLPSGSESKGERRKSQMLTFPLALPLLKSSNSPAGGRSERTRVVVVTRKMGHSRRRSRRVEPMVSQRLPLPLAEASKKSKQAVKGTEGGGNKGWSR